MTYFSATGPLVFDFGATLSEIEAGSSAEVLEDTIGDDIEGVAGASNHSNLTFRPISGPLRTGIFHL